jgi:hypothetical protein
LSSFTAEDIKRIVADFGVRTNVKQIINSEDFNVFYYPEKPYKAFILDCDACMKIACYSSILGSELNNLTFECSNYAFNFLNQKNYLNVKNSDKKILFYHILRASQGYNLHNVMKKKLAYTEAWIRTKYIIPSYRAHNDDSKELEIVFEDFSSLNVLSDRPIDLVIQDTVASGKTAQKALNRLFEVSKDYNINFDRIIFYGFISELGMDFLWENVIRKNCNELIVLALGNLTLLCKNGYDMPLYGPDESYYSKTGNLLNLGCIVSEKTIKRWIDHFIPGADQPGDWSERQETVFCGDEYQKIDLSKYINNSVEYLMRLRFLLEKNYDWLFEKINKRIEEEIRALKSKL